MLAPILVILVFVSIADAQEHVYYPEDSSPLRETVRSGASMFTGDTIWSANGQIRMTLQANGDVVVYRACDHHSLMATNTYGSAANELKMQPNGNLILYGPADAAVPAWLPFTSLSADGRRIFWKASTNSSMATAGASLRLENSGQLCLFKASGPCLWRSQGNPSKFGSVTCPEYVKSGESIKEDSSIWTSRHQARLTLEATGRAVIYRICDGGLMWSTNIKQLRHHTKSVLTMQHDGNAVIYEPEEGPAVPPGQKRVVWSTDTHASIYAGADLKLDGTGSLCLQKNGTCLWQSGGATMANRTMYPEFAKAEVIMKPGDTLSIGQTLWSSNRTCSLSFQTDRQIVLQRQCDNRKLWSLDGSADGNSAAKLAMQRNGLLILYNLLNQSIWNVTWAPRCSSVPTFKTKGADLRIAEDCRLCVFKDGYCHWTSSIRKSYCASPFAVSPAEVDEDDYENPDGDGLRTEVTATIDHRNCYTGSSLVVTGFLTLLVVVILLTAAVLLARWYNRKKTTGVWWYVTMARSVSSSALSP
ncbi:hypothetical protein BV898_04192 [Hypsibius exemplaris]|uniref:Bulb-type lectin domain-containing protein n=1 Tax=Hypsibius exemplaris TaxID=2072580 RepID=A0A1W0X3H5_HYPEX|nr:hypothetical protein BV898_04192 [Hypsibius exemplaris]